MDENCGLKTKSLDHLNSMKSQTWIGLISQIDYYGIYKFFFCGKVQLNKGRLNGEKNIINCFHIYNGLGFIHHSRKLLILAETTEIFKSIFLHYYLSLLETLETMLKKDGSMETFIK